MPPPRASSAWRLRVRPVQAWWAQGNPLLHPLAPHLVGKGFGSPHLVGGDPGVRATRGRLPPQRPAREGKRLLARLSVCRSGWCQPCRPGRTKLSFSAEGRTRNSGKGWFWNLLLLTCRVGPGYIPRPLTRKTETRLQGVSWTVERADPLALLNVGGPEASVRAAPLSAATDTPGFSPSWGRREWGPGNWPRLSTAVQRSRAGG